MKNLGLINFQHIKSGKSRFTIRSDEPFGLNLASLKQIGYFQVESMDTCLAFYYTDTDVPDVLLVAGTVEDAKSAIAQIEKEHKKSQFTVLNFNKGE